MRIISEYILGVILFSGTALGTGKIELHKESDIFQDKYISNRKTDEDNTWRNHDRPVFRETYVEQESSVSSLVGDLEAKLVQLGLSSLINDDYLNHVVEEAVEKEFQERFGVTRHLFNGTYADKVSIAYKPVKRDPKSPASKRKSGEDFLFLRKFPDDYVQLNLISGNSEWLPSKQDSSLLCDAMNRRSEKIYNQTANKIGYTAENLLRASWDSLTKDVEEPGCLCALYVLINPKNRISVSNLGKGWAGLYRNGQLIKSTHRTMHKDGGAYQLCLPDKVYAPIHQDPIYQSSRIYEWEGHIGDILVMVSNGVREKLLPSKIYSAFTTVQKIIDGDRFSSTNIDFSLVAMGIVKAALVASGEFQDHDLSAMAVVIE